MSIKKKVDFYTLIEDIAQVVYKDRKDENKEKNHRIKQKNREDVKSIYDFIFFEKNWPIEIKGRTKGKNRSVNKSQLYTEIEKLVKPEVKNKSE